MIDLLVIGAGAAGLAAAREGVRRGRGTVLVTAGPPGGDCTFTGCVPSKTLLAAAARGVTGADALTRVRATVARVAATETAEVLRGEGVDVRRGTARFVGPRTVRVEGDRATTTLRAHRVVVATGAAPHVPAGYDGALTTDTVFDLDDVPAALTIVGGGPAGCELAQAFARLGVAVTLVESAPRLLPGFAPDAAAVIADALARDGVGVRTAVDDAVSPVGATPVLLTAGRRAATAALDLPAAGIATTPDGAIAVDRSLATTARGVWAAGDVTGLAPHTHGADETGRLAVGNALGRRARRFDPALVPRVVFTDPELAAVGVVEPPPGARVGEVALSEVDRAVTEGREDGFVRLVAGARRGLGHLGGGRVLGATVVAPHAGEMIAEVALAMRVGAFAGRLAQTVHAYPTWTLAVRQAAARLVRPPPGTERRC